jgi:hypothetical protein
MGAPLLGFIEIGRQCSTPALRSLKIQMTLRSERANHLQQEGQAAKPDQQP